MFAVFTCFVSFDFFGRGFIATLISFTAVDNFYLVPFLYVVIYFSGVAIFLLSLFSH